jgi:hypothetical protein
MHVAACSPFRPGSAAALKRTYSKAVSAPSARVAWPDPLRVSPLLLGVPFPFSDAWRPLPDALTSAMDA